MVRLQRGGAGNPPNRQPAITACVLVLLCGALGDRPAAAQAVTSDGNDAEIFLRPGQPAQPLEADDHPRLVGQVLLALEDTGTFALRSTQGQPVPEGWNDLEPIVQGAAILAFDPWLSLQSKVTLASFSDSTEDQAFQDVDLQLDNLFLSYQRNGYSGYGGKFDVGIGDAQRVVGGVYLGFSGDSYYPGALGVGAMATLPAGRLGTQTFGTIVFKLDNTPLSSTLFGTQEALAAEEGGVGNTAWPKSFGFFYEIGDSPLVPGLTLGLDYAHIAAGQGDVRAMDGIAGRLGYDAALTGDVGLRLFGEVVHLAGFQGQELALTDLIGSAELDIGPWQVTATAARRGLAALGGDLASQGIASDRDWGLAGSLTYGTDFGLIFQAGLIVQEEQTVRSKQGVFRAIYQLNF